MDTFSTIAQLPEQLPVFPLTGTLLLPTNLLPLHLFEPRYRAMVEDAVRGDGMIGMTQPVVPRDDNAGPADGETEGARAPDLYSVGCAGWIQHQQRLGGGRYLVVLKGICRFRLGTELPLAEGGYRRVVPLFDEFLSDLREEPPPTPELDAESLLAQAAVYVEARDLELERDHLSELPPRQLINGLAAALPFDPAEKQALLEAPCLTDRLRVLSSLLAMGPALEAFTNTN